MKALQTILSFLLIGVVLMSSISHSVSFHFCSGKIENVAFFGKAHPCAEHGNSCDSRVGHNRHSLSHKGCCKDSSLAIDSDKYISKVTEKISTESYLNIAVPAIGQVLNDVGYPVLENTTCAIYKPPLIERDITVLVQTFLI